MAKRNTVYRIFIASPGDTAAEREIVHAVCAKLNQRELVTDRAVQLSSFGWEQAMPQAGDPQETINKLAADCDLLICLFHRRFGSPTANQASGTLEEF